MHTRQLSRALLSLAVVAFVAACEDEPAQSKPTLPQSNAPENVGAPDGDPARPVMRHGKHFGRGGPRIMAIMKHAGELGLSDEQKASIESIVEKARQDAPPAKKGQFKAHMEQMGSLIKAETLDADALTAGNDEMQAGHREMKVKMFSTYLDALEVLTPEQRTELFAIMKQHRGEKGLFKHKGKKGRFKHKGPSGFLLKAIRKMGDEMGQTAEQRASIEALIEESRADMAPLKDKKRVLRKEMHELMLAPQLDRVAIEAKHAEILDIKQEKESKRFAVTLQALELLTVDQRVALVTTLESCRPGKGMKGDATCKKLFGHKKGGKHFHEKPPLAGEMPAW